MGIRGFGARGDLGGPVADRVDSGGGVCGGVWVCVMLWCGVLGPGVIGGHKMARCKTPPSRRGGKRRSPLYDQ